jgi:hypothetical protein
LHFDDVGIGETLLSLNRHNRDECGQEKNKK